MRVCLLVLVFCLLLLVIVEGKSSKDSKSKGHSKGDGRVGKVRTKPSRHRSSDSSESSEEHKLKKKHSERFKSEERSKSHKISLKHNSTRTFGDGHKNKTGKLISLRKNETSHESLNFNANGHNENKTLIGWRIFKKPNVTKPNSVNETNVNIVNNFLLNEKDMKVFNGSNLYSNNNKWNNSVTPPPHGWKNMNRTSHSQGSKNMNGTAPVQGWKNVNGSAPLQDWKNMNGTASIQGWKNVNGTAPVQGWKNLNGTAPLQGWNNINASAPSEGWKNPPPVQGWNIEPSAPDYRQVFSAPDQVRDQRYYFDSPGLGGYFQRNPNAISGNNQPAAYPAVPDYNRKVISDIAPEYGWGAPQPSYFNNEQQYTGKDFNNYPTYKNYGSSEEKSSKIAKGVKKLFKGIGKATAKGLSSDQAKEALKQAASSYFANPPPTGYIYNPPYSNTRQTFYGRFSNPLRNASMSADDWRSVIFGNVPRKVETRNLYSAAFPETYQSLDLNAFSEKGRLPDFNRTQYKSIFPRPYYQKLFAGLQNEEINEHFRAKRELSEKGKKIADAINKFFLHERDCNDTYLDARRKRHLIVRPLPRDVSSRQAEEKRITNFPFSGVEAIVQSDYGISVYEEEPQKIQVTDNSTEENLINKKNTTSNIKVSEEITLSTTESQISITPNRTKLYPVSETIEQFLSKKPVTRLRVVEEPLEEWKAKARSESSFSVAESSRAMDTNDKNVESTRRIARSDDFSAFYRWITTPRYSDNEDTTLDVTQRFERKMEDSESNTEVLFNDEETQSNTTKFIEDNNEQTLSPLNFEEVTNRADETTEDSSDQKGFYFFGVYINDYNAQKWENLVSRSSSDESYELASTSDETMTTPAFRTFTEDSHIQTALLQRTHAIPALHYSQHEDSTTEKFQVTSSEPSSQEDANSVWPDYDSVAKPLSSIFHIPFRIHSISSISYIEDVKKKRRSTTPEYKDMEEPGTPGPSIIRAPLITNKCSRNQRMVKGRCRVIW